MPKDYHKINSRWPKMTWDACVRPCVTELKRLYHSIWYGSRMSFFDSYTCVPVWHLKLKRLYLGIWYRSIKSLCPYVAFRANKIAPLVVALVVHGIIALWIVSCLRHWSIIASVILTSIANVIAPIGSGVDSWRNHMDCVLFDSYRGQVVPGLIQFWTKF